jgi:hypothetical protein
MARIVLSEDLEDFLMESPENKKGCFVDTNLLFAGDYDSHSWNSEATEIGRLLSRHKIPIYSNVIIKSELLELKRRVLITENLVDFWEKGRSELPTNLFNKLKALKDKIRQEESEDRHFFLTDQKIKEIRKSFTQNLGAESWTDFCSSYLTSKLKDEWDNQVGSKKINYLSGQDSEFLKSPLEWQKMIEIIEGFGIGASDAMIINFFLSSTFTFLITADSDVAICLEYVESDKTCVIPSGLNRT